MDVVERATDAFWRHFLHGKPLPMPEHPQTDPSIISWRTPRHYVPRWYLEGSAVFFETWMAGGLGRAQGAYDEMVFRAKVRDNDNFYSPLGLESEGVAKDFQVGVNDYLYGTRFMSYLGAHLRPREGDRSGCGRATAKQSLITQPKFEHGLRQAARSMPGPTGSASSMSSRSKNLAIGAANFRRPDNPKLSPRGLGSISRSYVDPRTGGLIAASSSFIQDVISFLGRDGPAKDGKRRQASRDQGPDALSASPSSPSIRMRGSSLLYGGQLRLSRYMSKSTVDTGSRSDVAP